MHLRRRRCRRSAHLASAGSWLLLALAPGCSDYRLHAPGAPEPATSDSDRSDAACFDADWPPSVVDVDDDCHAPATRGAFQATAKWSRSRWTAYPGSNHVMMSPVVVSLTDDNGDGAVNDADVPDIVVVTYQSTSDAIVVRAVSGADGAELWDYADDQLDPLGFVAAGDLDGDGVVELVVTSQSGVVVLENDGQLAWDADAPRKPATSATPAISDMDGDGSPEIIIGRTILDANGGLRGEGDLGMANIAGNAGSSSLAVDLDGDGHQEVVVGDATYSVYGTTLWSNGEEDGHVGVADFDGDGQGDVVVVAQDGVRLQDADGNVLWRTTLPTPGTGPPVIADLDGDGLPEIGIAGAESYFALDTDGALLWTAPAQDLSSGQTGSVAFDFDEDGAAEIVYGDETAVRIFGGDGAVRLELPHSSGTQVEYATVADVDNDGHADIVVANNGYGDTEFDGLVVYEEADNLWPAAPVTWNEYAYHRTNVNADGTIPRVEEPSWEGPNDFRTAHGPSQPVLAAMPDLVARVLDTCDDRCVGDGLRAWVQVENRGKLDVAGDIGVTLWGETAEGTVQLGRATVAGLASGEATGGITMDVPAVDAAGLLGMFVEVDGDDAWPECDEANNTGRSVEPVCPESGQ